MLYEEEVFLYNFENLEYEILKFPDQNQLFMKFPDISMFSFKVLVLFEAYLKIWPTPGLFGLRISPTLGSEKL